MSKLNVRRYNEPERTRPADDIGLLTIVTNEEGQCVAVTRTDDEGRILKVIWEAPKPVPLIPEAGTRWQHRKGGIYEVILVTSEPEAEKAAKFPRSVVYRNVNGEVWSRTLDSWNESFKPL